jgi:uncharacterized membrane protein/phage FluMu protein Com
MKKMVRCRACGYIMAEAELGDKCPACGALRKVFEPYTDPMGEKRRRVLNLHLHPIAVHFPTTLAVAIFVFSIGSAFLPDAARSLLVGTMQILALFLPLVVLLAVLVGLLDGTTRFRRVRNSQILRTKITIGIVYFVLAIALALIAWFRSSQDQFFIWGIVLLAAGSVACSIVLALLGMSITDSAFPGE